MLLSTHLPTLAGVAAAVAGAYCVLGLLASLTLAVFASRTVLRPHYMHHAPAAPLSKLPRHVGPHTVYVHDPRTDFGLAFEDVQFPAWDGSTLRGWFVPAARGSGDDEPPPATVVLTHGGGRDRRAWLRHLPFLHAAGFDALLFDLRGHGASDGLGFGLSHGIREHEDVLAAVAFARTARAARVVIVCGTSVGGASCIVAAARTKLDHVSDRSALPRIDGVLAENPFSSLSSLIGGLVSHTVFWHGACRESRALYAALWPVMRTTQALVSRIVLRDLRRQMRANALAVSRYRQRKQETTTAEAAPASPSSGPPPMSASSSSLSPLPPPELVGPTTRRERERVAQHGGFHGLTAAAGMPEQQQQQQRRR
jgi:pimeloyl-ACP methyl ester carboxylesterase